MQGLLLSPSVYVKNIILKRILCGSDEQTGWGCSHKSPGLQKQRFSIVSMATHGARNEIWYEESHRGEPYASHTLAEAECWWSRENKMHFLLLVASFWVFLPWIKGADKPAIIPWPSTTRSQARGRRSGRATSTGSASTWAHKWTQLTAASLSCLCSPA